MFLFAEMSVMKELRFSLSVDPVPRRLPICKSGDDIAIHLAQLLGTGRPLINARVRKPPVELG